LSKYTQHSKVTLDPVVTNGKAESVKVRVFSNVLPVSCIEAVPNLLVVVLITALVPRLVIVRALLLESTNNPGLESKCNSSDEAGKVLVSLIVNVVKATVTYDEFNTLTLPTVGPCVVKSFDGVRLKEPVPPLILKEEKVVV
jgi:hypothetical protein